MSAGVVDLQRQWPLEVPDFGRIRFDLAVPEARTAVEVDVFPTHRETVGRQRDVARDAAVAALGWNVHRILDVEDSSEFRGRIRRIAASIAAELSR